MGEFGISNSSLVCKQESTASNISNLFGSHNKEMEMKCTAATSLDLNLYKLTFRTVEWHAYMTFRQTLSSKNAIVINLNNSSVKVQRFSYTSTCHYKLCIIS